MDHQDRTPISPIDLLAIYCGAYTLPPTVFIAWLALYGAWRLLRRDAGRK